MSNKYMNYSTESENLEDVVDEITLVSKVILFNDEWHSFDEVIYQIIKATGYPVGKAEKITNEVHSKGKAIAYEGSISKCLSVSSVLEEISLLTEIEM